MKTAAVVAAAALLAGANAAAAPAPQPYGPAPASLTWRLPPDGMRTVQAGEVTTLPRCATEIDVWIGRSRLRQRRGHAFTLANGRLALAGYVPVNRDLFTWTASVDGRRVRSYRVYWWCS